MKKGILFVLYLLCFACVSAQERKLLNGKITAASDDLEGVYVINTTANVTVASSKGGYFSIPAKVNDTLLFSSVQFVARYIAVKKEDFENDLLFVALEVLVRDLDEVTINKYRNLTAESLRLVPEGQIRFTPAERKLATAGSARMNPMGFDPIINWMSGRTTMLKNEVAIERKERLMDKINYIYTGEDIVKEFHIPAEYVNGFIFYIVEDPDFARALKEKNDARAKFLMNGLAVKYLDLIKNED